MNIMRAKQLKALSMAELKDHYDCINWLMARTRHRSARWQQWKLGYERRFVERELVARAKAMGYKLKIPFRYTQLRYPRLTQLTKLSTPELAERRIFFREIIAKREEGIDQNIDCEGVVCSATRYKHATGRKKAAEQVRRIEVILRYR